MYFVRNNSMASLEYCFVFNKKNQKIFFDRINFIINSIEEMHKKM